MARFNFDVETDGLLHAEDDKPELTTIHCLVIKNLDTGMVWSCNDHGARYSIADGLHILSGADVLVGHNIITFDIPAIKKVYPRFDTKAQLIDTLTMSRLMFPDLEADDYGRKKFPPRLLGSHSLEAWGHRLGVLKGDFGKSTDWKRWSPEMQVYCEQDVTVDEVIHQHFLSLNYSQQAIDLEHEFQIIIQKQEERGFTFSEQKASALYAKLLDRKTILTTDLRSSFPARIETMKPPAHYEVMGNGFPTKGAAKDWCRENKVSPRLITAGPLRTKTHDFNPGSRDQIALRLQELGWTPTKFTETGKPQIDEEVLDDVLATLQLPQAKLLAEYLLVDKRIGQIATGANAWLKLVRRGRIHGRVITNGAVTGRCTHRNPNVSQTPKVHSPYGFECRDCWEASPGYVLLGVDASGLELRCLAHYMAEYDSGAYSRVLLEGDIHSTNCLAMGLDPKQMYVVWGTPTKGRDIAKTFIYGYLYGAGDEKIGRIVGVLHDEIAELRRQHAREWADKIRVLTKQSERTGEVVDDLRIALNVKGLLLRRTFETKTPALALLKAAIYLVTEKPNKFNQRRIDDAAKLLRKAGHSVPKYRGWLRGIDGRKLPIRKSHAALNTLLQSAGALAVKQATVLLYKACLARGWSFGREFANVAHIHDEMQIDVRPELAYALGAMAVQSIADSGLLFNFRCPLSGEYKTGASWAKTH